MKVMKSFFCIILLCGLITASQAQSIIGKWQLIKQSNCMEEKILSDSDDEQDLRDEMNGMSSSTPQIVTFKEKRAGEESTRILNRKKSSKNKSFLYKFTGETLMILDKKSQTITANFLVDKFTADSLIISNASRPCETKIFLRLK
jgi:hypothetical protein